VGSAIVWPMPDGIQPPSETTAPELAAEATDGRLIRSVRRKLVLWSGGTTLLILLALAVALYAAVAGSLANSGIAQLDARMSLVRGERPDPRDASRLGIAFGGGGSGTFAIGIDPDGQIITDRRLPPPPPGLPDRDAAAAAAVSGRDVRTSTINGTPIRVLTETVEVDGQTYTLQVVQDRTAEQRTLETMLAVLIVGGLVVLLVAFGFGTIYARHALVPIRESLTNQRTALRRQREFAADASHELRTPLTVIRSSVDYLLRHRTEPVAAVGTALEDIDDEIMHMTSIVEDLLLLARSDSGAVELDRVPLDLGDVAADGASALSKPATDRGIRVEVDPQPAVISGDPARLRQLVMILVDNAIRHSPADGRVAVQVRADGGGAALVVEDDGPGIRPEDLPHVFERFYRAQGAPGGGTGLGLAIASWIVNRHGGRIEVANRTEGGARFVVYLPA
jgi:two-component system, OmpR family, sensor histidine kinase CiaH